MSHESKQGPNLGNFTSKVVMGPETQSKVLPKLMFDGTNIAQFHRDFPAIAGYYGFLDFINLKAGTRLTDEEDIKRERVARGILRNHITKAIDKQITITADDDLMTLIDTLYSMYYNLDVDA